MAQVAQEQEILEARMGESEAKRKRTKRALRDALDSSHPDSRAVPTGDDVASALDDVPVDAEGAALRSRRKSIGGQSVLGRKVSALADIPGLSDSDSEDDEEFFDAVDAGEVEVAELPPATPQVTTPLLAASTTSINTELLNDENVGLDEHGKELAVVAHDISSSFKGYEDGIRTRLKMDADDRPKVSLWVSFFSQQPISVLTLRRVFLNL